MCIYKEWDELPQFMRKEEVYPYYCIIKKRRKTLIIKRMIDLSVSLMLIVLLSPIMLAISIWIKIDSKGTVLFRQERVTQYGRKFMIYKFRTMNVDAEKKGSLLTTENDNRITNVGKKIRKLRLDEIPQLFNILLGDMSFVGTRPEVPQYVRRYDGAMWATLLLPAGLTSEASIKYKDEDNILHGETCVEEIYIRKVLPEKMKYNLHSLIRFNIWEEIIIMFSTLAMVIK